MFFCLFCDSTGLDSTGLINVVECMKCRRLYKIEIKLTEINTYDSRQSLLATTDYPKSNSE
jgi:hypothetical protein